MEIVQYKLGIAESDGEGRCEIMHMLGLSSSFPGIFHVSGGDSCVTWVHGIICKEGWFTSDSLETRRKGALFLVLRLGPYLKSEISVRAQIKWIVTFTKEVHYFLLIRSSSKERLNLLLPGILELRLPDLMPRKHCDSRFAVDK